MAFGLWAIIAALALVVLPVTGLNSQQTPTPDIREQAWQVLHAGLRDPSASRRQVAVQALSLMQGEHRAGVFAMRALHDDNYHVRAAAATTLGQLRVRQAIPDLRAALKDREASVFLSAAYSLYLLKDQEAYAVYYSILMGDRKGSDGLIQSQLDRLKDPKQMLQMGFEEGIGFVPFGGMGYDAYRQIHGHGEPVARITAARILAKDRDQITEDALMQTALSDKNEQVQLAALDALAERGDPKCIERLALNFKNAKSAVQYRTAAAILHLSDVERRAAHGQK